MLATGVVAALCSALLYAIGVTLQSIEARAMPSEDSLRPALLWHLLTRRRWLIGTACVAGGWGAQALALMLAPITIVQPALAVSVVALLFIGSRFFGETVRRREFAAALAIVVGVAGLVVASPGHSEDKAAPLMLALGLTALGLVALAPYALRSHRRFGALVVFSAGLAYAWTGFSTKFLADEASSGDYLLALTWLGATVGAAGVGLLSEMTALQRRSAIRVFPIVLVVQIVVAVLLAPLLAGERWSPEPLVVAVLAVSLAVVALGTRALTGARAVGRAISTDRDDGAAGDEAGDLGERGHGEPADHEQREQEAYGEREAGRQREDADRGGDHACGRRRQPDEVLAVLDQREPR
jgi:drug/metabolite transporter (DMT)-like permease